MHILRQFLRNFSVAVFVFMFAFARPCAIERSSYASGSAFFEPVGDYALSPDGKTIALTRAGQIVLRSLTCLKSF
jgi:hypothetical protein